MTERQVKVTYTGYFTIDEDDMASAFEASTFEEAVENQKKWLDDGSADLMEIIANLVESTLTVELVPEGEER